MRQTDGPRASDKSSARYTAAAATLSLFASLFVPGCGKPSELPADAFLAQATKDHLNKEIRVSGTPELIGHELRKLWYSSVLPYRDASYPVTSGYYQMGPFYVYRCKEIGASLEILCDKELALDGRAKHFVGRLEKDERQALILRDAKLVD